jgi:hypothetical protein
MANATALVKLSASTQGMAIKVAATSSPGTTIHTTGTSATVVDRLSIWAFNSSASDVLLTLELGSVTAPDQNSVQTITSKTGQTLVIDGKILLGNGSAGLTVKAFAGTTNVIILDGHVLRVTP